MTDDRFNAISVHVKDWERRHDKKIPLSVLICVDGCGVLSDYDEWQIDVNCLLSEIPLLRGEIQGWALDFVRRNNITED
jgi:hypothetical protein